MTRIEIEYCVPCKKLGRALESAEALLARFNESIDEVALMTGESGIFEVRVEDDVVFSTEEDDYSVASITEAVGDALN